jgi:hypothetical protein
MKEKKTQAIHSQPCPTHNQNHNRIFNINRLQKPLNGIQINGETECDQEDTVDQCTKYFCPLPTVSQILFPFGFLGQLKRKIKFEDISQEEEDKGSHDEF